MLQVTTKITCFEKLFHRARAEQASAVRVIHFDMKQLDRAITDSTDLRFLRMIVQKGRLAGANAIGYHAGQIENVGTIVEPMDAVS